MIARILLNILYLMLILVLFKFLLTSPDQWVRIPCQEIDSLHHAQAANMKVDIRHIKQNPFDYRMKTVYVEGKVIYTMNLVFIQWYWLSDGTDSILVFPARGQMPTPGTSLSLKGRVIIRNVFSGPESVAIQALALTHMSA